MSPPNSSAEATTGRRTRVSPPPSTHKPRHTATSAPSLRLTTDRDLTPDTHPALPPTGIVLIGTPRTVAALRAQLRCLEPEPVPAGCILIEDGRPHAPNFDPGCPILGSLSDLAINHVRLGLRHAVISLPSTMPDAAARVQTALRALGIPSRCIPTLGDQLAGISSVPHPAPAKTYRPPPPLDLAALIGRTPYSLDRDAVSRVLTGKRVLITGAGGSIGSELARVAAGFGPELLILMERSENALFEIDRQMAERFPAVPRRAVLHDVVDAEQTLRHLVELRPHAVFHAAAHKHVPLMEDHPGHAVTNNLFGTKSIADAAVAVGAERFVMISSDKAVNPRSVMGATKRLAEMYVRSLGRESRKGGAGGQTRLSMVRFGNVLGSACSVLTIWSQQLAEGGPITVTDPRMTRYFMTIPEAATLVIQSSAIDGEGGGGGGAPVYVLDMGEPVRIVDLGFRFVRAHGLEPRLPGDPRRSGGDQPEIDVVFTGIRPGEKLHEELAYASELLRPTGFAGINAWAGPAPEGQDGIRGLQMVADLSAVRHSSDRSAVLATIRKHVPELSRPDLQ